MEQWLSDPNAFRFSEELSLGEFKTHGEYMPQIDHEKEQRVEHGMFLRKAHAIIHDWLLQAESDKQKFSALLYEIVKARYEHADIVDLLLKNGADANFRPTDWTVLVIAVRKGFIKTVRLLLDYAADPNRPTLRSKQTPLMKALKKMENPVEMIGLLLAHGADPNLADIRHISPLEKIVSKSGGAFLDQFRKPVVYLLLHYGANPQRKIGGWSPIEIAQDAGFYELAEIMRYYPAVIPLKNLCINYVRKNLAIFKDQLSNLPTELQLSL